MGIHIHQSWVSMAAAMSVAIVGAIAENMSLVYWNVVPLNLLACILFEDAVFCIVFVLVMLIWALRARDYSLLLPAADPAENALFVLPRRGRQITLHQLVVCTGLLNTMWAILGLYASPGYRTPPLIQGILMNGSVLFVVPFSKALLGDRKHYFSPVPLFAGACIAIAAIVSLTPLIQSGQTAGSASSLGWIVVYVVSLIPGALEGVLEQMYLIRSHALRPHGPGVGESQYWLPIVRLLMWTSIWQLLFAAAFFFVDFTPWFGTSVDPLDFRNQFAATWYCSLGLFDWANEDGARTSSGTIGVGCDWKSPLSAWGASIGFVVSYVGGAALNRESATFSYLTYVLVTCITSAVFLIPGANPYPAYTPVWSVLTSLALSVLGLVSWKSWELAAADTVADQYSLKGDEVRAVLLQVDERGGEQEGDESESEALVGGPAGAK